MKSIDRLVFFICAISLLHLGYGPFWVWALNINVTDRLLEGMKRQLHV